MFNLDYAIKDTNNRLLYTNTLLLGGERHEWTPGMIAGHIAWDMDGLS